jgi:putative transposase
MTKPRQFLSDSTYFITRRTTQREFWLKPTPQTTQIFLYCIAVAAQKTGIRLHAACVMPNHWHAIVSDPNTNVAEFYAWVHKYVAKAVNCARGRWENLWSSEKTSVIRLESPEDVLDKTAYTLCNPVSAHLVAQAKNWKGVWLYRQTHSQIVKRPKVYFLEEGTMPESVALTIHQPPSHENMSIEAYEKQIAEEIAFEESNIANEMIAANQTFMGIDAVLRQSHSDKPNSKEIRRGMNPRFAAKDKELRISAIERYQHFVSQYWEALKSWRRGNRKVLFPAGTYAMRIHACVNVEPG